MQKLTTDLQTVVDALRASTKLKINDESTCVTRVDPLPEVIENTNRCVFVNGLPSDSNIDTVSAFFNGLFSSSEEPAVVCVRLMGKKRAPEAPASSEVTYDSFAIVEFQTEDQAKQVLTQPQYKFTTVNDEDKMISVAIKSGCLSSCVCHAHLLFEQERQEGEPKAQG